MIRSKRKKWKANLLATSHRRFIIQRQMMVLWQKYTRESKERNQLLHRAHLIGSRFVWDRYFSRWMRYIDIQRRKRKSERLADDYRQRVL